MYLLTFAISCPRHTYSIQLLREIKFVIGIPSIQWLPFIRHISYIKESISVECMTHYLFLWVFRFENTYKNTDLNCNLLSVLLLKNFKSTWFITNKWNL